VCQRRESVSPGVFLQLHSCISQYLGSARRALIISNLLWLGFFCSDIYLNETQRLRDYTAQVAIRCALSHLSEATAVIVMPTDSQSAPSSA
jgi:hypothetical protein